MSQHVHHRGAGGCPGDRVELVRALIEFWNTGQREIAKVSEYLDSAVELESPFSSVVGEPYRGYGGIERWMREIDEQFTEWSIDADDLRPSGNKVMVLATVNIRGRASDAGLQFPAACVCEFGTDDRIVRIRIYLDRAEAQRVVGIEG